MASARSFTATGKVRLLYTGSPGTVAVERSAPESHPERDAACRPSVQIADIVASADAGLQPQVCWICYMDETDDMLLSKEWRSPCPCALMAHETCLLDWLADLEKTQSRKRGPAKIRCPQCKSEIMVTKPQTHIVDMVQLLEKIARRLVFPGMVLTLVGAIWMGCYAYGVYSMYIVFGTESAQYILENPTANGLGSGYRGLNSVLPLVPLALVFSCTRYSDVLLLVIPALFFVSRQPGQALEFDIWPPNAAVAFTILPYVKSVYDMFYKRIAAKISRGRQPHIGIDQREDNTSFPSSSDQGYADEDLQGDNPGEDRNGHVIGSGLQSNLLHEARDLGGVVLGALVLPAISSLMGGLLMYVLPRSWTTSASALEQGAGLLQARWGRSMAGGCLFVFLKDATVLYCQWKLAQMHNKRRVLDYSRRDKLGSVNWRKGILKMAI